MPRNIITPWRTHGDLLQVRHQLYSSDPEAQRHAVHRVMAWKMRGNLPHAVESTALLIDAILHHHLTTTTMTTTTTTATGTTTTTTTISPNSNSIFSIRAVYSAAFARFVTGLCDIGRSRERSLEPSSMLAIAKQIGMPVEFVALRHEATHEELAGMQRLTKATEEALQWLWKVYWSRLEEPEAPPGATSEDVAQAQREMRDVLRVFRSSRREAVRTGKAGEQGQHMQTTVQACMEAMGNSAAKMQAVADVLVEDKLLVPSKRKLGSPLDGAFLIWDSLLLNITTARTHFLKALVDSLLRAIEEDGIHPRADADQEAFCSWLLHLLDFAGTKIQRHGLRREMITWCCTHPGKWSFHLGKEVLKSGSSQFKKDWQEVLLASQLEGADECTTDDSIMVDAVNSASVTDDMLQRAPEGISAEGLGLGGWKRAPLSLGTPIGVV